MCMVVNVLRLCTAGPPARAIVTASDHALPYFVRGSWVSQASGRRVRAQLHAAALLQHNSAANNALCYHKLAERRIRPL